MTEEPTNTDNKGGDGADQNEALKRLTQKNEEMSKKIAEYEKNNKGGDGGGEGEDNEPAVGSPEFIKRVIAHTAGRQKQVTDFIGTHPELAEYADEINKRLDDPSREKVPVDEIIRGAIPFDAMLKLGAKLQQEAEKGASDSRMGGGDGNTDKSKEAAKKKVERQYNSLPAWAKPKK